jgi:hypothetical protein
MSGGIGFSPAAVPNGKRVGMNPLARMSIMLIVGLLIAGGAFFGRRNSLPPPADAGAGNNAAAACGAGSSAVFARAYLDAGGAIDALGAVDGGIYRAKLENELHLHGCQVP